MATPNRAQRTEQPTAKKLSDAREEGNVPRSKELPNAMVLGMFLVFCHVFGPAWWDRLEHVLTYCFTSLIIEDLNPDQWLAFVHSIIGPTAHLLLVPVGLLTVAGVGGQLVQGAPSFTLKPLTPNLQKINPFKGIKKVFSTRSWVNLAKALFNMLLFTALAADAVRDALVQGVPATPGVGGTLQTLFSIGSAVLVRVTALWFLIAAVDLLFTRFDYRRNLMMTKQEVKDERKQMEGDPRIKARIRSKQMELARTRMMADVPKATVVITNPTHFAVALRYVPGEMEVPLVLAKGRDLLAQRIREIAREQRIPIIHDPALARAIYRSARVGGGIPIALYRAVAEVLALVLGRTRQHARPAGAPGGGGDR